MQIEEYFKDNAGRFDADLGIMHHFSAGVYAKQMMIPEGYTALSHKHEFDHMSILASGKVLVKTDIADNVYTAPACINIAAGLNHAILAIEDSVWFCVHATDETDEENIDEVLIKKEGN